VETFLKKVNAPIFRCVSSVTFAGVFRKQSQFAGFSVKFLGSFRRIALDGDVWPFWRIFGIKLQPALQTRLRVRLDGVSRAFWFAYPTVDAFIGMDDKHVLAFVEAIHGADFHAVHIFALDAVFSDDVGHSRVPAVDARSL
jgi:hypothetical protein